MVCNRGHGHASRVTWHLSWGHGVNLEDDDVLGVVQGAGEVDLRAVLVWDEVVAPGDAAQEASLQPALDSTL